ncbi:MAG: IS630 family transposase [Phormidesmis sp.]
MARYREEIECEQVHVLFMDECHLMAGDLEGYVWGRRGQRVEVPVVNERDRQTYYGALDLVSQRVFFEAYDAGNKLNTVSYLRYLQRQFPQQRLIVLWDGASYHRAHEVRDFLAQVNAGLEENQWRIHCVRFAPNDPTQNPIEDVWLQAKNYLRRLAGLKPSFSGLKALFEQYLSLETFSFPKMNTYGTFSKIK